MHYDGKIQTRPHSSTITQELKIAKKKSQELKNLSQNETMKFFLAVWLKKLEY